MTGMSMEWLGLSEVQAALARARVQADAAARANVAMASAEVIHAAMNNFEGSHRKNQPRVPNSSGKPNIVTGTLRRSIRGSGIVPLGFGIYTQTVGPTVVYGRRVELGMTGHGGAYPYFGPAVKVVRLRLGALAAANWQKHIKF